ncbi:hypothetical protein NHX12_007902 [Muraenolepis orangiensis]|uniref:Uncharacterized protein n=1 Tax=Muraenolepis orangiensis TaxID=630683 RepID=A0A9Q0I9A5_9TELE|nr:hypothetical protein NHX12_007902 [Muraenolepis orangiensis]
MCVVQTPRDMAMAHNEPLLQCVQLGPEHVRLELMVCGGQTLWMSSVSVSGMKDGDVGEAPLNKGLIEVWSSMDDAQRVSCGYDE